MVYLCQDSGLRWYWERRIESTSRENKSISTRSNYKYIFCLSSSRAISITLYKQAVDSVWNRIFCYSTDCESIWVGLKNRLTLQVANLRQHRPNQMILFEDLLIFVHDSVRTKNGGGNPTRQPREIDICLISLKGIKCNTQQWEKQARVG